MKSSHRNNTELTQQQIKEWRHRLDIAGLDEPIQVAIMMPVQAMKEQWTDYQDLLRWSIHDLCTSIFDDKREGVTLEDGQGRFVIAMCAGVPFDECLHRIEQLKDTIRNEYGIAQKFVLGSIVPEPNDIEISYHDALSLMKERGDCYEDIVVPTGTQHRLAMFQDTFLEMKRAMTQYVGDFERILRIFDAFEASTKSYQVSYRYVQRCCFDLASTLYFSVLNNLGKDARKPVSTSILDRFLEELFRCEKKDFGTATRSFLYELFDQKKNNSYELISLAKQYVMDHLSEDLSVASVAEHFYITPNYFSRLFKRVAGECCNDYIVRQRMERAKIMLKTTEYKTGKIAYLIGYRDTNYFSLAFKKQVGVSPTEYRQRFVKNA
jgi:two-component system response regulator YesN